MRYLIIFFFITFSIGDNYELKLYEKVFSTLFQKKEVNVFVDDNKKMFLKSKVLKLTDCKNCNIVLSYHLKTLKCLNKPVFSTSYIDYIHSNAIGAFYWRKGRPQLVFNKYLIQFYHLHLGKSLSKFVK